LNIGGDFLIAVNQLKSNFSIKTLPALPYYQTLPMKCNVSKNVTASIYKFMSAESKNRNGNKK